ncbi:helix-turn-helix domain-containing protein [Viridibacillus arvi]|uniref:helix-turn-helix domain-containing protein n=1 Tax=Viridibacillus arvi TaxID=263475 RepID=UPI0034CEDF2B
MTNHMEDFGTYLKDLRYLKGYSSQRSFAEKIGVSNSTIAKIERGVHEASEETLHKIAEALEVDYMDLLEKQITSNESEEELLIAKIKKLSKPQMDVVSNLVNEFLRMGGRL